MTTIHLIYRIRRGGGLLLALAALALVAGLAAWQPGLAQTPVQPAPARPALIQTMYLPQIHQRSTRMPELGQYVVIGWNDLGMHCYDLDYSMMSVLPPYNTLWAQVIRRGNPPQVVTSGVRVEYSFPTNTRSDNKTNFWQYAQKLFGVNLPLNVGLAGKGLLGEMDPKNGYFIAEGIPLTEFNDGATTPEYLQLANLVAKDSLSGTVLAQSTVVAPVSSEMHCETCHSQPTSSVRRNILQKHDEEEGTSLEAQALGGNPVLCAGCHADPALGLPGQPGKPSLSAAMHEKHEDEVPNTTAGCYACHPGPATKCLRDVMNTQYNLGCVDCHVGGMQALAKENRTPWVDLPRCASCHTARYAEQPATLYRFSKGHGGLYCEACHNSTHAILTSREGRDNLQSIALQGRAGTLQACTVCHLSTPVGAGPHQ